MKRKKKKLGDVNTENHLFDNWEYHYNEEKSLHDKIDELKVRCSLQQGNMSKLKEEIDHLKVRDVEKQQVINQLLIELDHYKQQEKIKKIPITEIVDYCKNCPSREEAKPIVDMLNVKLRCIGTDEDYKQVDSIGKYFQKKEQTTHIITKEVTIQEAQIQGALYEVKDNKEVNLGKEAI
jgi:hypothetical protein